MFHESVPYKASSYTVSNTEERDCVNVNPSHSTHSIPTTIPTTIPATHTTHTIHSMPAIPTMSTTVHTIPQSQLQSQYAHVQVNESKGRGPVNIWGVDDEDEDDDHDEGDHVRGKEGREGKEEGKINVNEKEREKEKEKGVEGRVVGIEEGRKGGGEEGYKDDNNEERGDDYNDNDDNCDDDDDEDLFAMPPTPADVDIQAFDPTNNYKYGYSNLGHIGDEGIIKGQANQVNVNCFLSNTGNMEDSEFPF